jgi:hypothetical protein
MTILSILAALSLIVGVVLAVAEIIGCAVGGFIDVAWFSILVSIAWLVGTFLLGCRLENPD